jgi:thiol-disulfide isomerase/thioredoxin
LILIGLFASGALLSAERPFTDADFDAAQRAGKPILVTIHADWCPTCRVQDQVLGELLAHKQFAGISVFRVDFDTQKSALKRFGVRSQSTLILFKGKVEVGRSIAKTDKQAIGADLAQLL